MAQEVRFKEGVAEVIKINTQDLEADFIITQRGDLIMICSYGVFTHWYSNRVQTLKTFLTDYSADQVFTDFELMHLSACCKAINPVYAPRIKELIGAFLFINKKQTYLQQAKQS